jgi:predicted nuclease of predicted toxin-antitoxin system
MKVLLDECLPRKFKNSFSDHDCQTVPEAGLDGQKNGRLLALAENLGFQLFLTLDKGLQYQQNLAGRQMAIVIIRSTSNRLVDLLPHVPECLYVMGAIESGQVARVGDQNQIAGAL